MSLKPMYCPRCNALMSCDKTDLKRIIYKCINKPTCKQKTIRVIHHNRRNRVKWIRIKQQENKILSKF